MEEQAGRRRYENKNQRWGETAHESIEAEQISREGMKRSELSDLNELIRVAEAWLNEGIHSAIDIELEKIERVNSSANQRYKINHLYNAICALAVVILVIVTGVMIIRTVIDPLQR